MTSKEWTLMVIAAGKNKDLEPVHLQKILFLLERNLNSRQLKTKAFYSFEPYDYGPFCKDVYADAEALASDGLVQIGQHSFPFYKLYRISPEGNRLADKLSSSLDHEVKDYLQRVVDWAMSKSFDDLVSAIYRAYPKMKIKSVFQGK